MWSVLALLGLVWALLASILILGLRRQLKFLRVCNQVNSGIYQGSPGFEAFMRKQTYEIPSVSSLYLGCLTIGPVRLLIFYIGHIIAASAFMFPSDTIADMLLRFGPSVVLFGYGLRVKQVGSPDKSVPLLVANHVSGMDGHVFLSSGVRASFVARAEVAKVPLVGHACRRMGCVFVKRDDENSRSSSLDAITNFLKSWLPGKRQLAVFAEGTTSNGTGVLPFKQGAFKALPSFQPIRLEYADGFDPFVLTDDMMMHVSILFAMPKFRTVTLTWLDPVRPTAEDTPETLALKAQEIIRGKSRPVHSKAGIRVHKDAQIFVESLMYPSRPSKMQWIGRNVHKVHQS